jgi:YgiT-type zinc finger domain-containing protein
MAAEAPIRQENLVETTVTYTLEAEGKLFVVENVPARVDEETGEQFFSPQTVERLQEIIRGSAKPVRVVETPVFDYAA